MKTIFPKALKKGDTIGIISPSQCVTINKDQLVQFERGIEYLKKRGYKVVLGKNAKKKYYYSAGTPKERLSDIHNMFSDNNVKAIVISLGGETANELLTGLNFKLIKENPKIITGISDATTLLTTITSKTGLVTFYGPDLIYTFGVKQPKEIEDEIWDVFEGRLFSIKPIKNLKDDNKKKVNTDWETIRTGYVKGKLIGGYLEIIKDLYASKYIDTLKNKILFLESMEGSHTIHMRLQYLKLLGVFDQIKGLIIGYFPDIHNDIKYYRKIGDIILELSSDKTFPILQVNELGHCIPNYAWPQGVEITLDSTNRQIIFPAKVTI